MSQISNVELGKRLKEARIRKELSQEYVAYKVGKSRTMITKYEKGLVDIPSLVLSKLCNVLGLKNSELFEERKNNIVNIENSINPFNVNRLYLYYIGYITKTKLGKYKLILDLDEQDGYVHVFISDYKREKRILEGHMIADKFIAVIRTENYASNYNRIEANQIIINISGGVEEITRGVMLCTNGEYIPNVKKVLISKKDLTFDDNMMEKLFLKDKEKKHIQKTNIWQVDIGKEEDFSAEEIISLNDNSNKKKR